MLKSKFPIKECVDNCYLQDVHYVHGTTDKGKWKGIKFIFERNGSYFMPIIYNPKKVNYPGNLYDREILRVTNLMESIFFTYLTTDDIMEAKIGVSDLEGYISNISTALKKAGCDKIPVDLKIIPDSNGNPTLPRYISHSNKYIPCIKKSDDITKTLRYTEYEKNFVNNLKIEK